MDFENKTIAALCHGEWKRGERPDEIIGYWAEDFTPYKIIVPPQLMDLILSMHKVYRHAYLEALEQKK